MLNIKELDFQKLGGLIPAVIIDDKTKQPLMLGFMNEEAFEKTIDSGKVTFFSRSKKRLWTKGETSGNFLNLKRLLPDCDNDTLLVYADPEGDTCHLGRYSCFNIERKENLEFILELEALIQDRKKNLPDGSYTTKLFNSGENRIIQKVGEEAVETVIAAKNNDKEEVINEVSDLMYHLLVMLTEKGITLSDIVKNLEKRHK